uniref:Transmembrane protein n=1 Tax=Eutreptiella gymnastica TaxID=73025 RepID=A0A6T2CDY2_9EUGL
MEEVSGPSSSIVWCILCCITVSMLPFIICDLYFAYNDTSECLTRDIQKYSIAFNLKTWLLVDGYTSLSLLSCCFLSASLVMCSTTAGLGCFVCTACFASLFGTFRLSWMIVGAIMFWGELNALKDAKNQNLCSSALSGYMWALLIISFISAFFSMCSGRAAKRDQSD